MTFTAAAYRDANALTDALTAAQVPFTRTFLPGDELGVVIVAWPSGRDRFMAATNGSDKATGQTVWTITTYEDRDPEEDAERVIGHAAAATVLADLYRRDTEPEHTRPDEVPAALDAMLDGIEVRTVIDGDPWLVCTRCDEHVCDVDDADTVSVLLRTVVEHLRACERLNL